MFIPSSRSVRYFLSAILSTILFTLSLQAQSTGTVRGTVVDPLGKLVPDAKLSWSRMTKTWFREGRMRVARLPFPESTSDAIAFAWKPLDSRHK